MNKPTDEELEDLDRLLRVLMTTDDEDPENGEPGWSLTVMRNQILAAGFRRRGKVNDEDVEAALHAYHGTTPLPGWVWRAGEPEAMRAALQAALEVGHE